MLKTEMRNQSTRHIDRVSTIEMMEMIQRENENAAKAVAEAVPSIACAVDQVAERMQLGGRMIYVGCGTSGRLAVLDASEIPPTYQMSPTVVDAIIAGGDHALRYASPKIEDMKAQGIEDIQAKNITSLDTVVGISVAGGAQYVVGAMEYAKSQGALVLAITSNEGSPIANLADHAIVTDTGPEPILGSTRMKAGTAHKMVLNMLSTGVMIKLGRVYDNLLIFSGKKNNKIQKRAVYIVQQIMECDATRAEELLDEFDWHIPDIIATFKK